jgi:hypothetical protein
MRHSSVTTTMRYVHDSDARNAADAIADFSETCPALPRIEKASGDSTA